MAKLIMLLVDDEADATNILNTPPQGAIPVGVFQHATQYCECENLLVKDGLVKPGQFARSAKYGWYIHKVCKKPRRGHGHYPKNLMHTFGPRELPTLSITIRMPYDPNVPFCPPGGRG